MLLKGLGITNCDLRMLRRLCPTTSIWTVDLAFLLRQFGADVTFCTVTLGANPAFVREARPSRPQELRGSFDEPCGRTLPDFLHGQHGGRQLAS